MKAGSPDVSVARRQRGAASIEFYIIAFWVLVPLLMAILQLGLFMIAKNTVNVATFAAARAGAASGMNRQEMKNALTIGVAPLYVARGMEKVSSAGFADVEANYGKVALTAQTAALIDVMNPLNTRISILNPTSKSFKDFGVVRPSDKATVIPVENLHTNNKNGGSSKQQRSDALLLKIEVRYCYEMVVPIINSLVVKVLKEELALPDPLNVACYAKEGVPIVSQAVVRMTVPPNRKNL